MNDKPDFIRAACENLLCDSKEQAKSIIENKYKFDKRMVTKRKYTELQKMRLYVRDGFVDRYTGERLVIPGILKVLSKYFPEEFPYQAHWKMDETHIAYWELIPTLDHVIPIAIGGLDTEDNWVTTSMKNNSIKSNFTLEQLKWKLHEKGNIEEWDGLTNLFIKLVQKDKTLLNDNYIKKWYTVAQKCI